MHMTHIEYSISDIKFATAMQVVLQHEGGLSEDKNDSGGITNYGVSLRFLKITGIDVDGDGDVDRDDVIRLTKDKASEIYLREWWNKYEYNRINAPILATKIFDGSVNMGAKQMHKLVQRALNSIPPNKLKVDGVLGKHTILAINNAQPYELLKRIRDQQKKYYQDIVRTHPGYHVFLKGWLRRAES